MSRIRKQTGAASILTRYSVAAAMGFCNVVLVLNATAGPATTQVTRSSITSPATGPIGARLDRSKTEYLTAVADAKHLLMTVIDQRISTATEAGDLDLVKSLQSAKSQVQSDGLVPDNVTDAAVVAAKGHFAQALGVANQRLANAFHDAVRDYTRARQIEFAEAIQAEYDATGLALITTGPAGAAKSASSGAAANSSDAFVLTKELPPYFESTEPYAVEADGIRPDRHVYLRTADADFLSRDFTFEVSFVAEQKENVNASVGIGEGIHNGPYWRPGNSLGVEIQSLGHLAGEVDLYRDGHAGQPIGKLPKAGPYIAQIQKRGNALMFAIGTEQGGKFVADITKRIDDLQKFAPYLNDDNVHLFFGHNALFTRVRLVATPGRAPVKIASAVAPGPQQVIVKIIPPRPKAEGGVTMRARGAASGPTSAPATSVIH
jgi:hypothetical protein